MGALNSADSTSNYSSIAARQNGSNVHSVLNTTKPLVDQVIDGYLTPIVVLFGIIGNCLNLAILGHRKSRSSSAMMLLLGMSGFDLFVLLVQIPHVIFTEFTQFTSEPPIELCIVQRQYATYIRYPFTNVGLTGAGILSATVAIDRYAAIKNVETLHRLFKRYTKWFIVAIGVFSVLFNSSKFFDMLPNTEIHARVISTKGNVTEFAYELPKVPYRPSQLASIAWYSTGSYWLSAVVNTLIPQLVMAIFGSIVVVGFAKLKRINAKKSTNSRENRISLATRMVVATICVFFVTSFLSVILIAAACVFGREALVSNPLLGRLRMISNFLAITKSGMNFVLYCSTCAHYRSALRGYFCKLCKAGRSQPQIVRRRLIDSSSTRSEKKQSGSPSNRGDKTEDHYLTVPSVLHADPASDCALAIAIGSAQVFDPDEAIKISISINGRGKGSVKRVVSDENESDGSSPI